MLALAGGYWWMTSRVDDLLVRRHDIPLAVIALPSDSASLAEGKRLAWFHDRHDAQLQGKVFRDEPRAMHLVSLNITRVIAGRAQGRVAARRGDDEPCRASTSRDFSRGIEAGECCALGRVV